jgi:hypothetical protein
LIVDFAGVYKEIDRTVNGVLLEATVDIETLRQQLAEPDMRPASFDVTFEGWLARIGLWGKVKVLHMDPEFKTKKEVTQSQLLKKISDTNLNKLLGLWRIEYPEINKVILFREYAGVDGKKYSEKFIVTVDLKPELKRALR